MADTSDDLIRKALRELGANATDAQVKGCIRAHAPEVPESQISRALRRIRQQMPRAGTTPH